MDELAIKYSNKGEAVILDCQPHVIPRYGLDYTGLGSLPEGLSLENAALHVPDHTIYAYGLLSSYLLTIEERASLNGNGLAVIEVYVPELELWYAFPENRNYTIVDSAIIVRKVYAVEIPLHPTKAFVLKSETIL